MLRAVASRLVGSVSRQTQDDIVLNSSSFGTLLARRGYHEKVIDHYENPRNVGAFDKKDKAVGTGLVGAPACGDVMKLQIKVDENGKIVDACFKTFGCGSAIASSSLATEWIKGKSLDEASQIKNSMIANELKLPPVKLHCSMLAEDAIQAALKDYRSRNPGAAAPGSGSGKASDASSN
jgi:Fe-S cluster assembly scaffold IscU